MGSNQQLQLFTHNEDTSLGKKLFYIQNISNELASINECLKQDINYLPCVDFVKGILDNRSMKALNMPYYHDKTLIVGYLTDQSRRQLLDLKKTREAELHFWVTGDISKIKELLKPFKNKRGQHEPTTK